MIKDLIIKAIVILLPVALIAGLFLTFYYDQPLWLILSAVAFAVLMAG